MDFAGFKETKATYQDKRRLNVHLRAKHGIPEPTVRKTKKAE